MQCSAILNNHESFVLDLLIMKNELDDDSNVMIMTEEIRKFSVFYVSFPNNFLNYFPNVLCSSTNYLRLILDYVNKMDWDYCLFCASSKEKTDKEKKKTEKTYKKIVSLIINVLNKICFRWKNFLVIIMKRQYSTYSK